MGDITKLDEAYQDGRAGRGGVYPTLEEALHNVAGRWFYEDCIVAQCADGFLVEGHQGTIGTDEWLWTCDDGVYTTMRSHGLEVSRLYDPAESLATARHVEHAVPGAVEALRDGLPVAYAYAIVTFDGCETCNSVGIEECEEHSGETEIIGWILLAKILEREETEEN